MQPWLATLAAPIAANAVHSLGRAAATGADAFAATLDRALQGSGDPGSCNTCADDREASPQDRIREKLADVLAPFGSDASDIRVEIDRKGESIRVLGDSPAADALRQALADDPQLHADLLAVAGEPGQDDVGLASNWPSFFTAGAESVQLRWNGADLVAAD